MNCADSAETTSWGYRVQSTSDHIGSFRYEFVKETEVSPPFRNATTPSLSAPGPSTFAVLSVAVTIVLDIPRPSPNKSAYGLCRPVTNPAAA